MVVELKDKLDSMAITEQRPAIASPAGVEADVVSALTNLGYDGRTAESAVAEGKREAGVSEFRKVAARLAASSLRTKRRATRAGT